ncbi:MAG: hypothetical protein AAFV95_26930 [Bacteroidota bacterium]
MSFDQLKDSQSIQLTSPQQRSVRGGGTNEGHIEIDDDPPS